MKTIFLVDDDADDRELFQSAVNSFSSDNRIVEAVDGKEALGLLNQNDFPFPDIIFLDLNMPKVNGLEVLKAIKKNPKYKSIPIFIYTTSNAKEDKELCLAEGASGFITKHYSFITLCEELKNLLSLHLH